MLTIVVIDSCHHMILHKLILWMVASNTGTYDLVVRACLYENGHESASACQMQYKILVLIVVLNAAVARDRQEGCVPILRDGCKSKPIYNEPFIIPTIY